MTAIFENETRGTSEPARMLDDDVLQSAGEAVLANAAPAAVLPGQGDPPAMPASRAHGLLNSQRSTLARRVAQQPLAASLLAFGAGAIATALLRSVIKRRRRQA